MNALESPAAPPLPPAWVRTLKARQFLKAGRGFERDGIHCAVEPRWLGFTTRILEDSPPAPTGAVGQPGLWTRLRGAHGERLVFDVPIMAVHQTEPGETQDGDEDASLDAYLRWVLASAAGSLPEGWRAPPRSTLESWIPSGALTVRLGSLVRQGELAADGDRWALRFPILASLPHDLPPLRERALLDLIGEACAQWRMVRLGIENTPAYARALAAEVDLSGAPHSQTLFLAGLDGLRHVVSWLAETADLLADVAVTLRSLDHRRPQNPNERTNT